MLTLTSLAETVPVKHRGYSLAALTAIVLPFCPYVLYAELFSHRSAIGWVSAACRHLQTVHNKLTQR